MNIKSLVILFCFYLIINSCSQEKNAIPKIPRLLKTDLINYKYTFGKPDTLGIIKETILFNYNGKDSIKVLFDENGFEKEKIFFGYDTLYNLIESITYDNNGKVKSKTKITYNSFWNILSSKEDNSDESYSYTFYIYKNNKLVNKIWESKSYFEYLSRWDISKYDIKLYYDSNNNLLSEKYYEKNKLSWIYSSRYDSLGRKIGTNYDGNLRKYFYDTQGNISEEISLSENGQLAYRWIRKYNENKIMVEEIKYNSLNEPIELEKKVFYFY